MSDALPPVEPDPLEELARAWRSADVPPPHRELGDEDEATRRAVDWVARAWNSVDVPPARPPLAPSRPVLRFPTPARVAAAAALLVAAAWWAVELTGRSERGGSPHPDVAEAPRPAVPDAPDVTAEPAAEPRVWVASVEPDRVELRAGNVRLIQVGSPRQGGWPLTPEGRDAPMENR